MELLKVIKFEGDEDTLVWKHPAEDFNTQSQLIVHESQEAIFFKDGNALDVFGPGKYTLKTENIPILRGLINIPTEGVSPFHCEVYFINKAVSLNMEWGTSSRFQILDPTFGILISVGASGSMEFQIADSRKFIIKVVGTQSSLTNTQLLNYFREKTSMKVKNALAKVMNEVSYLNVNQHLEEVSEAIKEKLQADYSDYGVNLLNFYLSTIFVPDEETSKLKQALDKKMEYGILDFNWADEQMVEIAKRYASNEGMQNNIGGAITQLPLAFAFGEMLKDNVVGEMQSPFSKTKAFQNSNNNQQNNPLNPKQETSNEYCPECGNQLYPNAKFCNNCGHKIERELKCSQCGCKITEKDKFCSNCGNKLQ